MCAVCVRVRWLCVLCACMLSVGCGCGCVRVLGGPCRPACGPIIPALSCHGGGLVFDCQEMLWLCWHPPLTGACQVSLGLVKFSRTDTSPCSMSCMRVQLEKNGNLLICYQRTTALYFSTPGQDQGSCEADPGSTIHQEDSAIRVPL